MRSSDATRKADRGGGESRRFVEDEEIFKNEIETRWYTGYFIRSHRYRVTRSNSSLSTFEIGNCADDRCVSLWIVDFWQVTLPSERVDCPLPPFSIIRGSRVASIFMLSERYDVRNNNGKNKNKDLAHK